MNNVNNVVAEPVSAANDDSQNLNTNNKIMSKNISKYLHKQMDRQAGLDHITHKLKL